MGLVCVCVCVCVCVHVCLVILVLEYLSFLTLFSRSNSSDAESWEGDGKDKCPFLYPLIGIVPSGRAVAASLDGTDSLSSVWLARWCSQRYKGTFWWVLRGLPITCFHEVGSSLMASFSYFPEVHSILFLESSFLTGCSLGSGIDKILPRCTMISQSMRDLHIFVQRWQQGWSLARFLSLLPSFFPSSLSSQR